jgi:uncharacterized repeat protein (TIGR03803 family)
MFNLRSWKAMIFFSVFCLVTGSAVCAQTFTSVANFHGTDGFQPWSMTLIQGTDGNLYGTTFSGGTYGMGTVFKVTPKGELTALYSFCAQTGCPDGMHPNAGLVQASDGNFYGMTSLGGANNDGTIFEITPEGRLTTLHSFQGTDGIGPSALIQAVDGNFYGGTSLGGNLSACPTGPGCGTIFEITAAGKLTTLHAFDGTDGLGAGPLIQASDGNFYGMTRNGGLDDCPNFAGCGTVFKMNATGNLTTIYSFHGDDGSWPAGALLQATNENFYGTTNWGGTTNLGTVFELTPAGELTMLHSFDLTDGSMPGIGLVQATDGNLYGTTNSGGPNAVYGTYNSGYGTIFEVTPEGEFTNLHNFILTDGGGPWGGLVQATDGSFYGATINGGGSLNCGTGGCGTIFNLSVGLNPFVKLRPTVGEAGLPVTVLGTDLTGTTKVTFNGKAAVFKVVSSTEIQATVPAEANTGKVEVTTPQGALSSNVPFRVEIHPRARHGRF